MKLINVFPSSVISVCSETDGVDNTVDELSSILKKLSSEGSSILMASHDIFRVRETCDRIGIIKKGELVKKMKTVNVSTNELEKIYIDYMQN